MTFSTHDKHSVFLVSGSSAVPMVVVTNSGKTFVHGLKVICNEGNSRKNLTTTFGYLGITYKYAFELAE